MAVRHSTRQVADDAGTELHVSGSNANCNSRGWTECTDGKGAPSWACGLTAFWNGVLIIVRLAV